MIRRHPIIPFRPGRNAAATHLPGNRSCVLACACTLAAFLSAVSIAAQVITIDTSGKGKATANGPIDRQQDSL